MLRFTGCAVDIRGWVDFFAITAFRSSYFREISKKLRKSAEMWENSAPGSISTVDFIPWIDTFVVRNLTFWFRRDLRQVWVHSVSVFWLVMLKTLVFFLKIYMQLIWMSLVVPFRLNLGQKFPSGLFSTAETSTHFDTLFSLRGVQFFIQIFPISIGSGPLFVL